MEAWYIPHCVVQHNNKKFSTANSSTRKGTWTPSSNQNPLQALPCLQCFFSPFMWTTVATVLVQSGYVQRTGYKHYPTDDTVHPYAEYTLHDDQALVDICKTYTLRYIVHLTTQGRISIHHLWYRKTAWEWGQTCTHQRTRERAHVFSNPSVAHPNAESPDGATEVAANKVAPKQQLSIPRLEPCAILTGAQLVQVLKSGLSLPIRQVKLCIDSTTVLTRILSESCYYQVFVGTHVVKIQKLMNHEDWWHLDR